MCHWIYSMKHTSHYHLQRFLSVCSEDEKSKLIWFITWAFGQRVSFRYELLSGSWRFPHQCKVMFMKVYIWLHLLIDSCACLICCTWNQQEKFALLLRVANESNIGINVFRQKMKLSWKRSTELNWSIYISIVSIFQKYK